MTAALDRILATPLKATERGGMSSVRVAADSFHVATISAGMNDQPEYARLFAAAPELALALMCWKCPGCGGSGNYQQDAKGRARKEAQGKTPDPRDQPDAVTCKVCNGNGYHPTAAAVLAKIEGPGS
jgi:hypothetical protein